MVSRSIRHYRRSWQPWSSAWKGALPSAGSRSGSWSGDFQFSPTFLLRRGKSCFCYFAIRRRRQARGSFGPAIVARRSTSSSSGAVEVTVADRAIRLGAGSYFGEMAMLTGRRRSADVTAVDYCKLSLLGQREIRSLLPRYPQLRATLLEMAQRRAEMNSGEARVPDRLAQGLRRDSATDVRTPPQPGAPNYPPICWRPIIKW